MDSKGNAVSGFSTYWGCKTGGYTWNTTSKNTWAAWLNTVPDANNNNYQSAYVDLNNACGQCHGGDIGACSVAPSASAPSTNVSSDACVAAGGTWTPTMVGTAPFFTKTQMSAAATNMHSGGPTDSSQCLACHGDNGDGTFTNSKGAGKLDIMTSLGGDGDAAHKNHHAYVACNICHTSPHTTGMRAQNTGESGTEPLAVYADGSAGNAFCRNCHNNNDSHARHHSVDAIASVANLACTSCHSVTPGQPGLVGYASVSVPSTGDTNTNCLACHQTNDFGTPTEVATPAVADIRPIGTVDHAVTTCTECHYKTYGTMELISMPETADNAFVNTVCGRCHGGDTSTTTTNGAPWESTAFLVTNAALIHTNGSPVPVVASTITDVTTSTSVAGGSTTQQSPLNAATGDTIQLVDASVSPVGNTLTVTVEWGDGSQDSGAKGGTFTHNYTVAAHYSIIETVTDSTNSNYQSRQYTFINVAAVAATNSIKGIVYNCYSAASTCVTNATAGVKVKLWDSNNNLVQQVWTADGTTPGAALGQYTFGHVDFLNGKTYTVTVKDPNHQNYVYTASGTVAAPTSTLNFNVDGSKTSTGSVIAGSYTIIAKDGTSGGNTYPNAKITITQNPVTQFRWTSSLVTPFRANFNNRTGNWTVTARWKGCSVNPVVNYTAALCTAASGTWIEPAAPGTQNCTVSLDGTTYSASVTVDPIVTIPQLDPNDPNGRPSITVYYNNCQ